MGILNVIVKDLLIMTIMHFEFQYSPWISPSDSHNSLTSIFLGKATLITIVCVINSLLIKRRERQSTELQKKKKILADRVESGESLVIWASPIARFISGPKSTRLSASLSWLTYFLNHGYIEFKSLPFEGRNGERQRRS